MVLVDGNWEDIRTEEDLRRLISEHIGDEVAGLIDKINLTWKEKYDEVSRDYENLQDEYDSLDYENDELQNKIDELDEYIKELEARIEEMENV